MMHIYQSNELDICPICDGPAETREDNVFEIHCMDTSCVMNGQRLTKRGWDEICRLGKALREMVDLLEDRYGEDASQGWPGIDEAVQDAKSVRKGAS